MKHYYRIWDAVAQVFLMIATLIVLMFNLDLLQPYLVIMGIWYFTSVGVHVFIGSANYKKNYKAYAVLTVLIISLTIIGWFNVLVWYFDIYILMYVVPIFVIGYTYICFKEIFYLRKRPISYLK